MSTLPLATPADADTVSAYQVTPARVIRSEWIELRSLRSLRSTVVTLGVAAVAVVAAPAEPDR